MAQPLPRDEPLPRPHRDGAGPHDAGSRRPRGPLQRGAHEGLDAPRPVEVCPGEPHDLVTQRPHESSRRFSAASACSSLRALVLDHPVELHDDVTTDEKVDPGEDGAGVVPDPHLAPHGEAEIAEQQPGPRLPDGLTRGVPLPQPALGAQRLSWDSAIRLVLRARVEVRPGCPGRRVGRDHGRRAPRAASPGRAPRRPTRPDTLRRRRR